MKVKILIDDKLGRWKRDEIGEVLENNFEKYDYFIKLPDLKGHKRLFYFFADEVEVTE